MPTLIRVSDKGQILIPVSIRRALSIKPKGQVVAYLVSEEKLIIESVGDNPIDAACGLLADADNEDWTKELLEERKKDKKKECRVGGQVWSENCYWRP